MPLSEPKNPRRSLLLAVAIASLAWMPASLAIATHAARGLTVRFNLSDEYFLIEAIFSTFLLVVGFAVLDRISSKTTTLRSPLGLPLRPTSSREFATGAAIGWAIILVSIIPIALAGDLHVHLWTEPRAFLLFFFSIATAALVTFASETAFRGFPYRKLIDAIGPAWATFTVSVLFALITSFNSNSTLLSLITTFLLSVLLCIAWLRTHGLWLGLGIRFAWTASLGLLFGLPVLGIDGLSSIIETRAIGARWLTGSNLGPEGALLTVPLVASAIALVVLVSSDWAWSYTRRDLVPAGYPMDVPPPAAHEAMERDSTRTPPPPLVQILPATPQGRSVGSDQ